MLHKSLFSKYFTNKKKKQIIYLKISPTNKSIYLVKFELRVSNVELKWPTYVLAFPNRPSSQLAIIMQNTIYNSPKLWLNISLTILTKFKISLISK